MQTEEFLTQLIKLSELRLKQHSFPDHEGRPGLRGGSLPRDGVGTLTPQNIASRTWYRGHKQGQLLGQTETFLASSKEQAAPFASQVGGVVSSVEFTHEPKVWPNPIPWEEYQSSWRNSGLLRGYDVVPVIEPNGQSISLAVRNPKILRLAKTAYATAAKGYGYRMALMGFDFTDLEEKRRKFQWYLESHRVDSYTAHTEAMRLDHSWEFATYKENLGPALHADDVISGKTFLNSLDPWLGALDMTPGSVGLRLYDKYREVMTHGLTQDIQTKGAQHGQEEDQGREAQGQAASREAKEDEVGRTFFLPQDTTCDVQRTTRNHTAAESRTDFSLIKSIYDNDAVTLAHKLRAYIAEARDSLVNLVERQAQSGPLTAEFAQSVKLDVGAEFSSAVEKFLFSIWRRNRDAAIAELPEQARTKLQPIKRFASAFKPNVAGNYFHNRALFLKGVVDDAVTTAVKYELFQHLKEGRTLIETVANIKDQLEPWIGTGRLEPSGITQTEEDIVQPHRLEAIVRTETTDAVNEARRAIADAAGDFIKAVSVSAILDDRTSVVCQLADGVTLAVDDYRVPKLTPPLHVNCRSILVYVTDIDELRLSSDEEIARVISEIPKGFA